MTAEEARKKAEALKNAPLKSEEWRNGYAKGYSRAVQQERNFCKKHPLRYFKMILKWIPEKA